MVRPAKNYTWGKNKSLLCSLQRSPVCSVFQERTVYSETRCISWGEKKNHYRGHLSKTLPYTGQNDCKIFLPFFTVWGWPCSMFLLCLSSQTLFTSSVFQFSLVSTPILKFQTDVPFPKNPLALRLLLIKPLSWARWNVSRGGRHLALPILPSQPGEGTCHLSSMVCAALGNPAPMFAPIILNSVPLCQDTGWQDTHEAQPPSWFLFHCSL